MNRRQFMQTGLGALGAGALSPWAAEAAETLEPMKIAKIEAITFKDSSYTWFRLTSDTGIVGLGETYPFTNSHIGSLKDRAGKIIGRNPLQIEKLWQDLYNDMSFCIDWGGAAMRALSALNIAQWDILGKALGVPVHQLLGGQIRDKIRVYNTYVDGWSPINDWRLDTDVERITEFLLDFGVKGIKILPYERLSGETEGKYITLAQLDRCLDWVKRIRATAGNEMEIAIEGHGRWNLPSALRIAESLEPYRPMWLEDMMLPDNMQSYATLARETDIPVTLSERLATRYQFREMLELKAVDMVMYDVTWCGGLTEAKKISDMADTYLIPTAPHDAGGPILYMASLHLDSVLANFWIQESSYHFYTNLYPDYIHNIPRPVDGFVTPPDGPGLGLEVNEEIFTSGRANVEVIAEL